jgi:hypothetical protein
MLCDDVQTVIFPYLDLFTKIKYSQINYKVYDKFFKLDTSDVQIILKTYGMNDKIKQFLKKRLSDDVSDNLKKDINKSDERKKVDEIEKIIKEFNINLDIILYTTDPKIFFRECIAVTKDFKFYEKLLVIINWDDHSILIEHALIFFENYYGDKIYYDGGEIDWDPFYKTNVMDWLLLEFLLKDKRSKDMRSESIREFKWICEKTNILGKYYGFT